jgi:hypothetical protein
LATVVALIGAQQASRTPVTAPQMPSLTLDDLETAEQDFVNPLARDAFRNLALSGIFDQFSANAGNLQNASKKIYVWNFIFYIFFNTIKFFIQADTMSPSNGFLSQLCQSLF